MSADALRCPGIYSQKRSRGHPSSTTQNSFRNSRTMTFDDLSVIQGEELFIDYGRKTDCFYLCNFGFVDFGTNKEEFKMHSPFEWVVTVMLVTSLCWWLYDGDWFQMLVAIFVMLVIFPMYQIGHQHSESVTNISNLSSTHLVSNIRHQHRCNRHIVVKFSG